jgi:hypothetical protein
VPGDSRRLGKKCLEQSWKTCQTPGGRRDHYRWHRTGRNGELIELPEIPGLGTEMRRESRDNRLWCKPLSAKGLNVIASVGVDFKPDTAICASLAISYDAIVDLRLVLGQFYELSAFK